MYENEPRSAPVLDQEDNVLIITRPQFVGDRYRHFVGIVDRCISGAMKVHGYGFVYDQTQGGFVKRKSQLSRIFALDNHIIIFVLPDDIEISAVCYEKVGESGLVVTDKKHFKMELDEFNVQE